MTLTQITEKGIKDGEIINADINASAAIAKSKLASLDIVNADVNASAAIASSKLAKPIDFADNEKARFGTGNDLQISHTGGFGKIQNSTGDLNLYADTNVGIYSAAGSEIKALFATNGAVELYYDNDLHFATTSLGCKTNGDLSFRGDGDAEQILFDASDGSLKFTDSKKAKFGDAEDLQVYHDGSHSRITNSTGNLIIDNSTGSDTYVNSGGDIYLRPQGTENGILINGNGAVELYYDNSKKFETESSGCKIDGSLELTANLIMSDNDKIRIGNSQDLEIYHDGNSKIQNVNNSCDLRIISNSIELKSQSGDEFFQKCTVDGAVELYYDNSKKFETTSGGIDITGDLVIDGAAGGTLTLGGSSAHTSKLVIASNAGNTNGNLLIEGGDGTDFITINSGGNVEIHDGNLKVASGHGIDFSATSDASGKTSELLDDYEEGTFSPDWQGSTTGGTTSTDHNYGGYTKIGNTVHVRIYSKITSTTATGHWVMHNLPFIGANSLAAITTGSCMIDFLDFHNNSSYVVPYKNSNTNDFELYSSGDSDGWRVLHIADDSNFSIILSLTYQAA